MAQQVSVMTPKNLTFMSWNSLISLMNGIVLTKCEGDIGRILPLFWDLDTCGLGIWYSKSLDQSNLDIRDYLLDFITEKEIALIQSNKLRQIGNGIKKFWIILLIKPVCHVNRVIKRPMDFAL